MSFKKPPKDNHNNQAIHNTKNHTKTTNKIRGLFQFLHITFTLKKVNRFFNLKRRNINDGGIKIGTYLVNEKSKSILSDLDISEKKEGEKGEINRKK